MPSLDAKASAVHYPATNSIYVFGGENAGTGMVRDASWVFDSSWPPLSTGTGASAAA